MNEDFDERHYVTPRTYRGPLYLPRTGLTTLEWAALAAVLSFGIGMLIFTDCGATWCW